MLILPFHALNRGPAPTLHVVLTHIIALQLVARQYIFTQNVVFFYTVTATGSVRRERALM